MVTSACKKCGEILKHADYEVPPSGIIVKCPKCQASVTVLATDNAVAPVAKSHASDLPAPVAKKGMPDLPAPVAKRGMSDLPAPVAKKGMPDLPAPVAKRGMPDLPAPVAKRGMPDLPAPVVNKNITDLPAPIELELVPDLLAPVVVGLPVPSTREKVADLPGPVQTLDLAPVLDSEHENMLKPIGNGIEQNQLTPISDNIPSNLVSPIAADALHDLLAPISLGEPIDLGDPIDLAPEAPLGGGLDLGSPGDPLGGGLDLGSPVGQIEGRLDLGDPLGSESGLDISGGLDLGDPLGSESGLDISGGLDLGDPLGTRTQQNRGGLDLSGGLDLDSGGLDLSGGLDSLDLQTPDESTSDSGLEMGLALPDTANTSGASDGIVTFGTSSKKSKPSTKRNRISRKGEDEDAILDLEDQPLPGQQRKRRATRVEADNTLDLAKKAKDAKRQKISLAILGTLVLGAGGFYGYQWFSGKQTKTQVAKKQSGNAQRHLSSDEIGHWEKAISEASNMVREDPKNSEAFAIAAQAHYASILDQGTNIDAHYKKASNAINAMRKAGGKNKQIALAEGMHAMATRQYDEATKQLLSGIKKNPKSAIAHIYLGWTKAAQRKHQDAISAFDQALSIEDSSIVAQFGKANSLLALAKNDEASESYLKVSSMYRDRFKKDHLGAIVGIAQLAQVEKFGDREKRYLEILAREDLTTQNQRSLAKVWALAGDEARAANRLAVAGERYNSALKADPANLNAVVGQAAISVAKSNLDDAKAKLERVLALAPGHIDATLLFTEVEIARKEINHAANLLNSLFGLRPKIEYRPTLAKMELLRGQLLAADPDSIDDAIEAYKLALSLSDGGGIEASLALADLYTRAERKEDAKATLLPLRERAGEDASLAIQLGLAYLTAKEPKEAIYFLELAIEDNSEDSEAQFQLGRSLAMDEQKDKAVVALNKAYQLSDKREDIGLELADMYRQMERDADAKELYLAILEASSPSRNARAKAGAYFARVGDLDSASKIGEQLLAEDPNDAAGHFLKGEALLAKGDAAGARDELKLATRENATAQYFSSLGYAHIALEEYGPAISTFKKSIAADPNYLNPRIGLGMIRLARKEYSQAVVEMEVPLKIAPDSSMVHIILGRSQLSLRKHKEAILSFQRAHSLEPTAAVISFYLGKTYDATGNAKSAAKAYNRATTVAKAEGQLDQVWVTECFRLLGYAIRESGGSSRAQLAAFESYISRIKVDDPLSKEVREFLIPLRAGR